MKVLLKYLIVLATTSFIKADNSTTSDLDYVTELTELTEWDKEILLQLVTAELQKIEEQNQLANSDFNREQPSEKPQEFSIWKEEKPSTIETAMNESVIEEHLNLNQNDSVSRCHKVSKSATNKNIEKLKSRKSNGGHSKKNEELDQLMADHITNMFCDLCQFPFKCYSDMLKHFSDSHRQRGYFVCCKKKYFQRILLTEHLQSHVNPDRLKCDQCGQIFVNSYVLKNHILRVHGSSETNKKFECDECGKVFAEKYNLRRHMAIHVAEKDKKFKCEECGKLYGSSIRLNRHIREIHLKKYCKRCNICDKIFWTNSLYKIHMNEHAGIARPVFSCDICDVRLTTAQGLQKHKDSHHSEGGTKEHSCPKCPKVSPTLNALRKHIIEMHRKGHDHKCTTCGKMFKWKYDLKKHMNSHTRMVTHTTHMPLVSKDI